ncbi:hypothetical protein H0H87_007895 [Tephrocybe sp. NHM501043]|nr:hypothetical protein H0H87_007895 [Tephrocybe sp. NHM501043]
MPTGVESGTPPSSNTTSNVNETVDRKNGYGGEKRANRGGGSSNGSSSAMSIFTRPASPPPRQPSPELDYTPLPSPHVRARLRTMSGQDQHAPATPPGLAAPRPRRPILAVRSFNDLPLRATASRATPPATPRSLSSPSRDHDYHHHRRTLSNAIPYRSPPPSPIITSPPPPVPPIPAFVLSSPATVKHCPKPAAILPIHLPDLDSLPPLVETTNSPRPRKLPSQLSDSRTRAAGMTCLRFFSTRNTKRRAPPPPTSVA